MTQAEKSERAYEAVKAAMRVVGDMPSDPALVPAWRAAVMQEVEKQQPETAHP